MIKGLIIAAMLSVMTMPTDVEKLWSDAQAAFEAYRFDEAITLMDEYMANAKHNKENDVLCAALRVRAERAAEMMEAVEDITILDSVKTIKSRMTEHYGIPREAGMLRLQPNGGVTFTTGRGDRGMTAEETKEGEFDLFVTYTDGERQALPDNVNTSDNENYPFEMTDGATLYFASDGHGTIGGYDLFMTRYNNETQTYTEPMRVGMPFNSIYNDYMMAIDELSDVGWFATDRYQRGDTVVIYKFRVTGEKRMLPAELDADIRIASAQMRRYRLGYDDKRRQDEATTGVADIDTFSFVVNDTLIYTSESQFRDTLSLQKYHEIREVQKAIDLQSIILEGKKRDYRTSDNEEDRALLRKEILEDEEFLNESRRRINTLTREIRKLEYLKL